jgi:hypothetical protein
MRVTTFLVPGQSVKVDFFRIETNNEEIETAPNHNDQA